MISPKRYRKCFIKTMRPIRLVRNCLILCSNARRTTNCRGHSNNRGAVEGTLTVLRTLTARFKPLQRMHRCRRVFGSGDCPTRSLVWYDLEIRPELCGWSYHKPQSPSFASHPMGIKPGVCQVATRSIRTPELSRSDKIVTMATAVCGSSNHPAPV